MTQRRLIRDSSCGACQALLPWRTLPDHSPDRLSTARSFLSFTKFAHTRIIEHHGDWQFADVDVDSITGGATGMDAAGLDGRRGGFVKMLPRRACTGVAAARSKPLV